MSSKEYIKKWKQENRGYQTPYGERMRKKVNSLELKHIEEKKILQNEIKELQQELLEERTIRQEGIGYLKGCKNGGLFFSNLIYENALKILGGKYES